MADKRRKTLWYAFNQVLNLGFIMASTLAVGVILGRVLDIWLGTSPLFTVGGILLGLAAGCYGVFKQVIQLK